MSDKVYCGSCKYLKEINEDNKKRPYEAKMRCISINIMNNENNYVENWRLPNNCKWFGQR